MINGVELVEFDQTHQVRKFERGDTFWFHQFAEAGNKIMNVGNMSQHIIGRDQIRTTPVIANAATAVGTKKTDIRVRTAGDTVRLNTSRVIAADIETDNATVHLIDRVLIQSLTKTM